MLSARFPSPRIARRGRCWRRSDGRRRSRIEAGDDRPVGREQILRAGPRGRQAARDRRAIGGEARAGQALRSWRLRVGLLTKSVRPGEPVEQNERLAVKQRHRRSGSGVRRARRRHPSHWRARGPFRSQPKHKRAARQHEVSCRSKSASSDRMAMIATAPRPPPISLTTHGQVGVVFECAVCGPFPQTAGSPLRASGKTGRRP
jgi:hypothetical protein